MRPCDITRSRLNKPVPYSTDRCNRRISTPICALARKGTVNTVWKDIFIMNVPGIAGEACWFVDQGLWVRGKPVGEERIQPQRTEGTKDCGAKAFVVKRSLSVGEEPAMALPRKAAKHEPSSNAKAKGSQKDQSRRRRQPVASPKAPSGSAACRVASPCAGALAD